MKNVHRFAPVVALVGVLLGFAGPALAQGSATAQVTLFSADLSGSNVVPAVDTQATGWAVAVLRDHTLVVGGTFSGLGSDLATEVKGGAHIHQGASDANGGIVFELTASGTRDGTFSGTFQLDDTQVQSLKDGQLYVQLHSEDHKSGVLRGQLQSTMAQ